MKRAPDIAQIKAGLADHAEAVARDLLPLGRREGRTWREARRAVGGLGDSLAVEVAGERRGLWCHAAAGRGGDLLDLHQYITGGTLADALAWARAFLGLDGRAPQRIARREPPPVEPDALPLEWSDRAEAIWRRSVPLPGTPAAAYLAGRGCVVPNCADLRFLAGGGEHWPALVARVTDAATAEPLTLHFTRIVPDGSGKAPIDRPRLLLKGHRKAGGVIRLVGDAEVSTGLGIGEGIETALSVMAAGWSPIWAAIDAGNIRTFPVLAGIECLTIFSDNDPAGLDAARTCARRWAAVGREARVIPARHGDWNDVRRAS